MFCLPAKTLSSVKTCTTSSSLVPLYDLLGLRSTFSGSVAVFSAVVSHVGLRLTIQSRTEKLACCDQSTDFIRGRAVNENEESPLHAGFILEQEI